MTLLSYSMSTYRAYGQLRNHLLKYIKPLKHVWHIDVAKKIETKTASKKNKR